jgi:deazaflavin-dependent oxidoreductase (nitroreductase family)
VKRIRVLAGGAWLAVIGAVAVAGLRRRRMPVGPRETAEATVDAATRASPAATGSTATEIAPAVYLVGPWGRTQTNAYLVQDGSSWMLVDAGWAGDAPRIRATVRSVIGSELVPSAILLTHAHPDHCGSARELARAWGCPVFAHRAELPLATGDFAAMVRFAGPLDRWLILPVMRAIGRRRRDVLLAGSSLAGVAHPLGPGGAIPGVAGWEWVHAPGHTPGHVAYVRARDRVVLSGDAVLTLEVNTWAGVLRQRQGISGPPWYTTWNRQAAIASIVAIADLEPTVLAGGHGLPLAGPGTAAAVHAFANRTTHASRRGGPDRRSENGAGGNRVPEDSLMSVARLPPRWFIRSAWVVHRALYSATGGGLGLRKPTGDQYGLMRVRTIGRRTGAERAAILGYFEDGPNLVTMAMNGWADPEPAWWLNLQAHPDTSVDLVDGSRLVHARAADPEERPRLWDGWATYDKGLDSYAARRSRETAVVILEPRPA